MRQLLLLSCFAALVSPALASGQGRRVSIGDSAYTFERRTRERWLHGRQQPAFTAFSGDENSWISVDSVRGGSRGRAARVLHFSWPRTSRYPTHASVAVDARGRVVRVTGRLPRVPRDAFDVDRDTAERARWEIFAGGVTEDRLLLPQARVWDLVPSFDAPRPAQGVSWTDTLGLEARLGAYRQSLRGVRVSTIVGDTTLATGRRLWIVRDSALVHYEEHALTEERTLDTLVVVERAADGTIVGRHLYDPGLALFRVRHDTTLLAGEAVLRYPDGRTFRTPARFERTRRIDLYDRASLAARREAIERERGEFSIVIRPEGVAERLASGDSALGDSLLREWDRARDPRTRAELLDLLDSWGGRVPGLARRMRALALAAGDTAFVVRRLLGDWHGDARAWVDSAELAFLLPFMADPGLAFAFGERADAFYGSARDGLLGHPPAITPDTTRRPCTPAACRALAARWPDASEPRLRDLALVARMALEPARWADTVLARAAAGSALLRDAVPLIRGVGATWPAAAKDTLPGPNAGWRAWAHWMNGYDPRYARLYAGEPRQLVRFEETHSRAIRFYQARTGRDVVGELRAKMRAARGDTARYVFGSMLLGLGDPVRPPEEIAASFRSGLPLASALASRELRTLFPDAAHPADSAAAVALMGRALRAAIEGAAGWTMAAARGRGGDDVRLPRRIVPETGNDLPLVIKGTALPPALRAQWSGRRGARVVDSTWHLPSDSGALVITPKRALRAGPFVRIALNYADLGPRVGGRGLSSAGGWVLYLMRSGAEWVLVDAEMWIT